jgi:hypothetical protein
MYFGNLLLARDYWIACDLRVKRVIRQPSPIKISGFVHYNIVVKRVIRQPSPIKISGFVHYSGINSLL